MKKVIAACVFVVAFGLTMSALKLDFTPIKRALTSVLDTKISKENDQLKKRVATLTQQTARLELLEKENQQLKALLDTKINKEYTKTYANVISMGVSDELFITVDRGATDGIKSGDVAVFGAALIGRVIRVFDTHSHIQPISAPDASVGAQVADSGSLGYTESSRQGFFENTISLTLFGAGDFAAAGDEILTSGLGTAFPKGLLIGSVVDSTKKEQSATIRTAVDVFSLHTVCILSEVGK